MCTLVTKYRRVQQEFTARWRLKVEGEAAKGYFLFVAF